MGADLFRALGFATALFLCGCAPISTAPTTETITVSRTPYYAICAGVCPFYSVTVSSNGEVVAKDRMLGRMTHLRVTRAEADQFFRLLRPYRPASSTEIEPICVHPEVAKFEPIKKAHEIEIVWSGAPRPTRLIACDNGYFNEPLRQALWSVHLYVTADPRPN